LSPDRSSLTAHNAIPPHIDPIDTPQPSSAHPLGGTVH
jgi:hypothetical protein